MTTPSWVELSLPENILSALSDKGYESPTSVQAAAIPPALEGKDLIVRSQTGTGKTAAFLLPTLSRIPDGYGHTACLVLCPTRELAMLVLAQDRLTWPVARDKWDMQAKRVRAAAAERQRKGWEACRPRAC